MIRADKRWTKVMGFLGTELRHLVTINPSDRPWQMPFAAALATGLPLLVGSWFGHLEYGLVSSLGGLVFLYMPATALSHRMVMLMACAFAMTACYTLGVMSHFVPVLMMPVLVFIAILTTMLCRFYGVGMPGSLFFIMAASIGAYAPTEVLQVPLMVGLISMGALLACLIAFFYSVYILRRQDPKPVPALPQPSFETMVFDPVVIGVFVGISLALAQVLDLEKAYWVPVSCLAVIQGASLRAVWTKQIHRVVGTGIGLLLSWGLLSLPLNSWSLSVLMMVLAFIIETAVVRHYAFATIFITPLAIMLAEAATLGHGSPSVLIHARLLDTVLGSFVGLVGGICLHSSWFRDVVGRQMRRLGR
ncbi:FUSC family protein [Magnetospirillum sulfuroxidans]|uniref:FUSC family protein n=1 Tax=Magnetospirillum sulfuroxidans TaxID=611300 RepID=A0ABS5IG18_9PROT|nr:FUSC family protein [Magnetospirillum sulfuroxidans]MBR9973122.1 FUSC family protein [Magnetospirillum sulfuroxidans]